MSTAAEDHTIDRLSILKTAFGAENAKAFEATLNDLEKNSYDAYAFKLKANQSVMKTRQTLARTIPQFWLNSLKNCRSTGQFIDPVDEETLKTLEDVWIEHSSKDCREWEVTFTFKNSPTFSNTTLTRSFTLTPPSGSPFPSAPAFDLDAPLFLSPLPTSSRPQWKSSAQNLCQKAPRQDPRDLEEFDEFGGAGSWFHFFEEGADGEDEVGMGEMLLQWWANATEYAAGLTSLSDSDSEQDDMLGLAGSDDDSDDEDPTKEIELGSEEEEEERPRKRSKGRK